MSSLRLPLAVLVLMSPLGGAAVALANPVAGFMPEGVAAKAPFGFMAMCQHDPDQCIARAASTRTETAAAARNALLETVNAAVNRDIRFTPDVQELWQRPRAAQGTKLRGDCEDYALEKRARLLAAGFPAERLSFAVAYIPRAGLHTVLVARMEDGDRVLDNRTPWIRNWQETGYIWLLRQSSSDPLEWRNLLYQRPGQLAAL